jgi:hypothetical protein
MSRKQPRSARLSVEAWALYSVAVLVVHLSAQALVALLAAYWEVSDA